MEEKDRGRDFLFSKYYGFMDSEDEDGDYQIYSDGCGYYHGSDGSKAQIYSDGSGYFHGADGSEAQISRKVTEENGRIRKIRILFTGNKCNRRIGLSD